MNALAPRLADDDDPLVCQHEREDYRNTAF